MQKPKTSPGTNVSRRAVLAALVVAPLAGCAPLSTAPRPEQSAQAAAPTPSPSPAKSLINRSADFAALETRFGARLGVLAHDTGTAAEIHYRVDERFAFCSTAKAFLAAMVLSTHTPEQMNVVVPYTQADLIAHSPITTQNLRTGMTLTQLSDAAVRYSDNAAANLLYAQVGGPAQVQRFLRDGGDEVTRMDRIEPDLSFAVPGDLRDTTTPQQWGKTLEALVLGDMLAPTQRDVIIDLLRRNTTGATTIRAAVPAGWAVADKTGSGWYGTRNDIAVLWPPARKPIVVAIMSSRDARAATIDDELIAQAARVVTQALG